MTSNHENQSDYFIQEDFDFEGFQVVRGEFFAHISEPSFTLNNYKCGVNTACIKNLPNYDYIQILVNPDTKKLAVRPCNAEEKDSFRWCSATSKRTPKMITCHIFFAKIMTLMNWDTQHRYKLLGKLVQSKNDLLYVFDLNSPEIYESKTSANGKTITSRVPTYSGDWKNQFGLPVSVHQNTVQISTFKDYTVFSLEADTNKPHTAAKKELVQAIGGTNESEQLKIQY